MRNPFSTRSGFTLLEMLIVIAIIGTVAGGLFINFRSSATNATGRRQAEQVFVGDLRRAQSMALAGSQWQGVSVCGYGVHYVATSSYLMYARPLPVGVTCRASATSRNYIAAQDTVVASRKLSNPSMQFQASFSDIYFEIPEPKTYLNNNVSLNATPIAITILPPGASGRSIVTVYPGGRIDTIEQ